MDTKELALTPSMTLDFLPIRPIPSPSDDDMTLNQDINADRRVKRQKEAIGNDNSVAGWHAFYTARAGITTLPLKKGTPNDVNRYSSCGGPQNWVGNSGN